MMETRNEYWAVLWRHRELLLFLAWRDILVRYKQTVLGVAWTVLRPVLTTVALTLVFGRIANLSDEGVPYSLLVFTGMLPWILCSNTMTDCSQSLHSNSHLISKVYFPRLIIPASAVLVVLLDYLIAITVLVGLMSWYSLIPTWRIIFFPLFTIIAVTFSFGLGILIAVLNVHYRDFRHLLPFLLQLGLYISPVGYSSQVVPPEWHFFYYLNPLVGIIDGFRWSILGTEGSAKVLHILISTVTSLGILIVGIYYFKRYEGTFADRI